MYATASDIEISTYPDLWRKGRYRVELSADLPFDPYTVEAALQHLGYHIVDADQWGQSYCHNQDRNRTAELDELEDFASYVRLVLWNGNLNEADINAAEDYLSSLYDRICQVCGDHCDGYDYGPFADLLYPDEVQEMPPALRYSME